MAMTDYTANITKDTTRRPVLVYGTLRKGEGNYYGCIVGYPHSIEIVRLPGFQMYGGWGFPYVIEDDNASIVAELVTFEGDDETYQKFLRGLDTLEGYYGINTDGTYPSMNHYDRILTTVEFEDGREPVEAYIYVANRSMYKRVMEDLPAVEGGDWIEFSRRPRKTRFEGPLTYDFLND